MGTQFNNEMESMQTSEAVVPLDINLALVPGTPPPEAFVMAYGIDQMYRVNALTISGHGYEGPVAATDMGIVPIPKIATPIVAAILNDPETAGLLRDGKIGFKFVGFSNSYGVTGFSCPLPYPTEYLVKWFQLT